MAKLTKQISKKNIVGRQSTFSFWFLSVLIILFAVTLTWGSIRNMILLGVPLAGVCIIPLGLFSRWRDRKILQIIEKQERYLNTDFDRDMNGVYMQGILSNGVEAVGYRDWYLLLSVGGVIAVNRRYVTGVKSIEQTESHSTYTINYFIHIVFDTVEGDTIELVTGNSWQAAEDLRDWLEAYWSEEKGGDSIALG